MKNRISDVSVHKPLTTTLKRTVSVPTSLVAVTSYWPAFFTEHFLTESEVRSGVDEMTASSSGWPLSDHVTLGVGTPDTVKCWTSPAPAFNVRVGSSFMSLCSFGGATTTNSLVDWG